MNKFFLNRAIFFKVFLTLSFVNSLRHHQNFTLLRDFTCAVIEDELKEHPEMQNVALIELENNFPLNFSREVLKCLPKEVAKLIIMPHCPSITSALHTFAYFNFTILLPKQTMIIYIADKVDWVRKKISKI